jgi:hypothetical protein
MNVTLLPDCVGPRSETWRVLDRFTCVNALRVLPTNRCSAVTSGWNYVQVVTVFLMEWNGTACRDFVSCVICQLVWLHPHVGGIRSFLRVAKWLVTKHGFSVSGSNRKLAFEEYVSIFYLFPVSYGTILHQLTTNLRCATSQNREHLISH